jgi:hypothetical protein
MGDEFVEDYADYDDDEADRVYDKYLEHGFPKDSDEEKWHRKRMGESSGCLSMFIVIFILTIIFLVI